MITRLLIAMPALTALAVLALGSGALKSRARAVTLACFSASALVVIAIVGLIAAPPGGADAISTRAVAAGDIELPMHLGTSPSTAMIAVIVAVVAAAVQVYAWWYLAGDDRRAPFAATVALFTAAMMLVVHSRDLVLTLIGWEVMGWCSYVLIGHWSRRESARRAAHKAFLVTRVADIGFVLGVVGLIAGAKSSSLPDVLAAWSAAEPPGGPGLRSVVMCLLVVGVLGKSAQFPYQDWLPDAMEGPTPASALIHAATMVAAGSIVLAQLFPVLAQSSAARWMLAISVSLTMVGAAVLALGQSDLKRLLAWSTVSQVAIMLSALATAAPRSGPDSALFHMWSHAIFKSLLFLTVGWLALVAGTTLASGMRASTHVHQLAQVAWLIGLLSLAGAPFVVGGLSKEQVISTAYEGAVSAGGAGVIVLISLLVTVVLTAAYAMRAYLVVSSPVAVVTSVRSNRMPPGPVVASLAALTALTVMGGLVLITGVFELHAASLWWIALTVMLIVLGGGITVLARGGRGSATDPRDAFVRTPSQRSLADAALGVDAAYQRLVARPVIAAAKLAAFLDRDVIDAYARAAAHGTTLAGWMGERSHRREAPSKALGLVVCGFLVAVLAGVVIVR